MQSKYRVKKKKKQVIAKSKKKTSLSSFKSKLERDFAAKMLSLGIQAEYEPDRFRYQIQTHYTPDFRMGENFYVETKGYFSPANRSRLLSFREQYPNIIIYLVFQNANNKLSAKSKTTYRGWAEKHQIPWIGIEDINKNTFEVGGK